MTVQEEQLPRTRAAGAHIHQNRLVDRDWPENFDKRAGGFPPTEVMVADHPHQPAFLIQCTFEIINLGIAREDVGASFTPDFP